MQNIETEKMKTVANWLRKNKIRQGNFTFERAGKWFTDLNTIQVADVLALYEKHLPVLVAKGMGGKFSICDTVIPPVTFKNTVLEKCISQVEAQESSAVLPAASGRDASVAISEKGNRPEQAPLYATRFHASDLEEASKLDAEQRRWDFARLSRDELYQIGANRFGYEWLLLYLGVKEIDGVDQFPFGANESHRAKTDLLRQIREDADYLSLAS